MPRCEGISSGMRCYKYLDMRRLISEVHRKVREWYESMRVVGEC